MADPYRDLVHGVQALRRTVERDRFGLGGALGVAAFPYPHQLLNVQRILAETEVRHLLADEVGLGKTVQALMVLNALRLQNPDHRALILAPLDLTSQWWHETRARGHIVAFETGPEPDTTGQHVRIAWPEAIETPAEIDPAAYDLLIVDEIQRLPASLRQRVENVAAEFRQLLLLSATPRLDDPDMHRQLLALLEPDRMTQYARDGSDPVGALVAQETAVAALLERSEKDWQAAGLEIPPERGRRATAARSFSTLRRVIRTRRADFPDLLPSRVHNPVAIEPTDDEVERQAHVWRYMAEMRDQGAALDLVRLGQVALRSPRSLAERINILRNRDKRDPSDRLLAASRHLDAGQGDSRIEALVDLLAGIWAADPDEPVLVVAEDNPTVDYLERVLPQHLPEIGPPGQRRPLALTIKRNRDASASELMVDLIDDDNDGLGGFQRGEDILLIAADTAQVGLNLQHARKLVFFSVPWSPQAVEQWIGRIDRLGSAAIVDRQSDRTIEIFSLFHRGQVDERVVSVLESFAVFRRSIRLDGEQIRTVSNHIAEAALSPHSASWDTLVREARSLSREDGDEALTSPLSHALGWTPDAARALADRIDSAAPIEPYLGSPDLRHGLWRSEAGLRQWMTLLARCEEVRLWKKRYDDLPGVHVRLLHYFKSSYASGPVEPRFALPNLDPRDGRRIAFLDSRQSLQSPPLRTIDLPEDPETPLTFLDHGNPVHEALVGNWLTAGRSRTSCLDVRFPEGHPLADAAARGIYLVSVASFVAGRDWLERPDTTVLLERLATSRTRMERQPLLDAIRLADEQWRADQRWVNTLVEPGLDVVAAHRTGDGWSLCSREQALAFLAPTGTARDVARGTAIPLPDAVRPVIAQGKHCLLNELVRCRSESLADASLLPAAARSRQYQAEVEARDRLAVRRESLAELERAGAATSEQGFMRSRYRAAENLVFAQEQLQAIRTARLAGLKTSAERPSFSDYRLVVIRVS